MDECTKKHVLSIIKHSGITHITESISKLAANFDISEEDLLSFLKNADLNKVYDFEPIIDEISRIGNVKRCTHVIGESGAQYVFDMLADLDGFRIAVYIKIGKPNLKEIIKFLMAVYDAKIDDWLFIAFPTTEKDFSSYSTNIIEAKDINDAVKNLRVVLEDKRKGYQLQHYNHNSRSVL
ncbi:MAG: hypothetical protein RXO71_05870 [Nitrososphaeria archaeon]